MPKFEFKPGFLFALLFVAYFSTSFWIFCFIWLSIVVHELGHLVPAYLFGEKIDAIGFGMPGIYIRRTAAKDDIVNLVIALGGPAISVILANVTHGFIRDLNWFLFLVSMLPIPGTDLMNGLRIVPKRKQEA